MLRFHRQVVRLSFHCLLCLWSVKVRPLIALRLSHDEQVQSQMSFGSRPPMNGTARSYLHATTHQTVKPPNMIFFTFGHGQFVEAMARACHQAERIYRFNKLFCLQTVPKPVLQAHDWSKHLQFALGYGYWFWKPALAYHILHSMSDGDVLFYTDAGTRIRNGSEWTTLKAGITGVYDPMRILFTSTHTEAFRLDNLVRQMTGADILAFHLSALQERTWTKGDIFAEFGVTPHSDYGNTPQICATYFFVKKSRATMEFMGKWIDLVSNLNLLTDIASNTTEDKTFKHNRHDQSLFSMLLKANHPMGDLTFRVDGAGIPHFVPDPKHAVPNLKVKLQESHYSVKGDPHLPFQKNGNKHSGN
eukprot:gnl/TRDRNA2_/TRDRNA2_169861_c0_seq7.p1 gnl/TRDRNA2_/TRDRNA2_169861_c0~~gnl/TRDRNA2_/TRDRNA2_169861_c0_seq7.p1  ORF type:complete len:360 (-),score=12.46 gnl/TRDRNA2_/TRDRNA2_169861_c0_seq7:136-1215(-)